jgi:hypothetical protein
MVAFIPAKAPAGLPKKVVYSDVHDNAKRIVLYEPALDSVVLPFIVLTVFPFLIKHFDSQIITKSAGVMLKLRNLSLIILNINLQIIETYLSLPTFIKSTIP